MLLYRCESVTPFAPCPQGFICVDGRCLSTTCNQGLCPPNLQCRDNRCVAPCGSRAATLSAIPTAATAPMISHSHLAGSAVTNPASPIVPLAPPMVPAPPPSIAPAVGLTAFIPGLASPVTDDGSFQVIVQFGGGGGGDINNRQGKGSGGACPIGQTCDASTGFCSVANNMCRSCPAWHLCVEGTCQQASPNITIPGIRTTCPVDARGISLLVQV